MTVVFMRSPQGATKNFREFQYTT